VLRFSEYIKKYNRNFL